jgi:hypothetical protein
MQASAPLQRVRHFGASGSAAAADIGELLRWRRWPGASNRFLSVRRRRIVAATAPRAPSVTRRPASLLDHTSGLALVPTIVRPRADAHLQVPDGSTLLLYTDGLVEHRGVNLSDSIAELGRRAAAAAGCPLGEFCDRLLQYAPGSDAVALLVARVADPAH